MRTVVVVHALVLSLLLGGVAVAEEETSATAAKKVPWRGSVFSYENTFSALSLSKSVDPTWNPYYAQSLSFRPRFYPLDDLYIGARLDLEIELTTSDDTDHKREWIVSDLLLDVGYWHKVLTIPAVGVKVRPSIRFTFPTSIVSRGRSLVMGIGPSLAFSREFKLLKGNVLSGLTLTYAFRPTKYLHRYAYAQIDVPDQYCMNSSRPECQHRGRTNLNWQMSNYIGAKLQILKKLSFSADLFILNGITHKIPAQTYEDILQNETYKGPGSLFAVEESAVNHRASLWAIFDVSYDVLDWLSLSVGTSTYHPQLSPDSSYYGPFFNRFTNFYFTVSVPIDAFVDQVQSWAGRGKARSATVANAKESKPAQP